MARARTQTSNGTIAIPAPPLSRLYAYVIDWILGGVVTGLPAVLIYLALTKRKDLFSDLYVFEALGFPWAVGITAGLLCIAAAIGYFVVIPLVCWKGQTPGKRIAHIRVAALHGGDLSVAQLLVRQVIVGFIFEGSGYIAARFLRETLVLLTHVDVNYYWEIAGMVITAISLLMFLIASSHRCLHDRIAQTQVVPADGHPLSEN